MNRGLPKKELDFLRNAKSVLVDACLDFGSIFDRKSKHRLPIQNPDSTNAVIPSNLSDVELLVAFCPFHIFHLSLKFRFEYLEDQHRLDC